MLDGDEDVINISSDMQMFHSNKVAPSFMVSSFAKIYENA